MTKKLEPVTVDTLREIITAGLHREAVMITIHRAIADVLVKFTGKPITKRALTAIRAAYPSWTVTEDESAGMLHYRVRGGDSGLPDFYDNSARLFVTDLLPDGVLPWSYDPEAFEIRNASNGSAAITRNAKRASLLKDTARLRDIVNAINHKIAAAAEYAAVVLENDDDNPDSYAMRELAEGEVFA